MCTQINSLFNSPYDKEFLIEVLTEWYNKSSHNTPDDIADIVNRYHKYEKSNKWFFTIIKHLDENVRKEYIKAYAKSSINYDININNSSYCFEDIIRKQYNKNNLAELITDYRGVVGVIEDRWFIKKNRDGQAFIEDIDADKFCKKLRPYKPFKNNDNITLGQILCKYSRYFIYDKFETTKENKQNTINLFQGFKYEEIITDNYDIIKPFLEHIKNIICNNDDEKYNYFMRWWANIFQNVTVKNGTMLIIYGAQGSGKSFPIEVFCDLLGKYALANVDDLDKVFGKFNGLLDRSFVININEPPESTEKFKYLGKIKAKLTQKKSIQERKGQDQLDVLSWANFTMTTNNPSPIQEEKGDRRTIYYETNNSRCGDEEYFNKLCKPIQETPQGDYNKEFMGVLLHYMKTEIKLDDFNPERLIRQINNNTDVEYNEQLERQYLDLNNVDKYVVDNYEKFERGLALDNISITGYSQPGIIKKLNYTCTAKRMTRNAYEKLVNNKYECIPDKQRFSVYTIKPKEQIPDLWNIIKYIQYKNKQENDEENNNEE